MRKKKVLFVKAKRAAGAGLFLGILLGLGACTEPVVGPGETNTPVPTVTVGVIPSQVPETPTPEPTKEPEPTATSAPSAAPTATSAPTQTPTPVPKPTEEPEPTVTPVPSATNTPVPTEAPEVLVTPTPVPLPTGQPEYETLLQNGWQRTGDFFGCREIFFSGKFDRTELSAVPGRYEYRYTASSDEEISFSVIGEEGLTVQQFLDELTQRVPECRMEQEAEEDYRYTYLEGELLVQGRIYACGTQENRNRMRIEFRGPGAGDVTTEGYEFYLK